jgi:hypothetical protein
MDNEPETWKPPRQTGMPAARSGRGDIERAGKLVGLHANEDNHAALAAKRPDDAVRADAGVVFIDGLDAYIDVGAEDAAVGAIEHEAVHDGEGVRGNGRAEPLDDVAVVVVVRRLDEDEREVFARERVCLRS